MLDSSNIGFWVVLAAQSYSSLATAGVLGIVFGTLQLVLLKRLPDGHPLRQLGFMRHFSERTTRWYGYATLAVGVVLLALTITNG